METEYLQLMQQRTEMGLSHPTHKLLLSNNLRRLRNPESAEIAGSPAAVSLTDRRTEFNLT